MDRKKIKMLVALHGWRIRCRKVYVYDESSITSGFTVMHYAWLENSNKNYYMGVLSTTEGRQFNKSSYGYTRTQAINNMLDAWYNINKHTLEK